MIPIFSFIGESKSGKTFLLEKVIIELRSRGFRVGVIKHSHSPFEIDKREKDSWKFKEAGAEVVAFSSKEEFLLFKKLKNEISLDEIIKKYFNNVDIILTEGYRKENFPKILVLSGENKENFSMENIIAIVSNKKIKNKKIPSFSFEQINELINFLLNKI